LRLGPHFLQELEWTDLRHRLNQIGIPHPTCKDETDKAVPFGEKRSPRKSVAGPLTIEASYCRLGTASSATKSACSAKCLVGARRMAKTVAAGMFRLAATVPFAALGFGRVTPPGCSPRGSPGHTRRAAGADRPRSRPPVCRLGRGPARPTWA